MTHLLSSADISIFSPEISKFSYMKTYRYRFDFGTYFLTVLTFFESLNPAGKYWSPGRPEDVPLQRPQDVP